MNRNICPCIGETLATIVAIEALEHNAVQSERWTDFGKTLKVYDEQLFDRLKMEYPELELPITEPLAEIGASAWLIKMKEKCGIETEDIKQRLHTARDKMKAGDPSFARHLYVDAKTALLDKAIDFCGKKEE